MVPIILSILFGTYYSQNYASIRFKILARGCYKPCTSEKLILPCMQVNQQTKNLSADSQVWVFAPNNTSYFMEFKIAITFKRSVHCASGPGLKTQPWYPMLLSNVNASTIPITTCSEPDSRGHGRSTPANARHTTRCMEHLRHRYREQELSEKATSLMLKSWRTKTNKS